MADADENVLHLLVIEQSRNDAEAYNSILRAAGFAVRLQYIEDAEDLAEGIDGEVEPDLVLFAPKLATLTLADTLHLIKESGKDIPVIAIVDDFSMVPVLAALRGGATAAIGRNQPDYCRYVVSRELANLRTRRALAHHKALATDCERRARALLESSRDAIAFVTDGMHIYANGAYLALFGFQSRDEIEGMPVMDLVATSDHPAFKEFLRSHAKTPQEERILEVQGQRPDGSNFSATFEFSAATMDGEPCTQLVIRDQSLSKELEKKIQYLSNQDMLTGLYNRQYFIEELEVSVSRAGKQVTQCALLYIELDRFDEIKKQVGIAASDLVLSDIAGVLKTAVGPDDILARFGDSTFTVLTCDRKAEEVIKIAERIRGLVEGHVAEVGGRSVTLTCSIGVCSLGENTKTAQDALARADVTCAQAVAEGGNRVRTHNPVTQKKATEDRDKQWISAIQQALQKNQLALVYQPIVSMRGSDERSYEALLRMQNPSGGDPILPGEFLPVAEAAGLAKFIDQWVLMRVLRLLVEQQKSSNKTRLYMHVSSQTLCDPSMGAWMAEQIRNSRIQGEALTVEISEGDALAHIREATQLAQALRSVHARVCISNFTGNGPAWNLLRHVPSDSLKVTRTLMHQLAQAAPQQKALRELCDKAHEMNLRTIASFVEDANSLAVIYSLNVDYIQGYFLQVPSDSLNFDFSGAEM